MSKQNEGGKKPKKRLTAKSVIGVFYDKKYGTVIGRTPKDWVFLVIFLVIFYAILFGYFALLLYIFIVHIAGLTVPFRTGDNSLIGRVPSVVIRPFVDNSGKLLLASRNATSQSFSMYSLLTEQFLAENLLPGGNDSIDCASRAPNVSRREVCRFTRDLLGPCSRPADELLQGRLCMLLRINNIYGWLPNVKKIPPDNSGDILVECAPVNDTVDRVHLGSLTDYYPSTNVSGVQYGRFQSAFYPYLKQNNYVPPIVAVRFSNITTNVLINIVCSVKNSNNVQGPATISVFLGEK